MITAPFTPAQVLALERWQRGIGHPFTCPNRSDGKHHVTSDLGALVPTMNGWTCPNCDYT